VEVRQNPPKNQIGIVDKNPDYYYLYVKPLHGKNVMWINFLGYLIAYGE
jgi:hypothetical protein